MNKFIVNAILVTVWSIVIGGSGSGGGGGAGVNAQTWAGAGATAGQGLPGRNPDFSYGYGGIDSRGNVYGGAGGNGGYYVGRTDEHGRPYGYGGGVGGVPPQYPGGAGGIGAGAGAGYGGYGGYGSGSPFSGGSYPRGPYYNAASSKYSASIIFCVIPVLLLLNKFSTYIFSH